MDRSLRIAVAVVAMLALALGTAGTVYGVLEAGKVAAQARQLRQEQAMVSRQQATISSLSNQVTGLGNQVSSLNAPSDPLSAYNEVCWQNFYNQSKGGDQTYYFPCTNQAQTIPQPGN